MNKIDLMHKYFGRSRKHLCKECSHYKVHRYHDKTYRKCEVYGETSSAATDWKASYIGCGLAPDKPYDGRPIVQLVSSNRDRKQKIDEPIAGQISIFDQ